MSASWQTRRAWRVLACSSAVFVLLLATAGIGFTSYRANATKPRGGVVAQIIGGTQVDLRPHQQINRHSLHEGDAVREGDTVLTGDDTRVKIILFDQTEIDLSANTQVTFGNLRASQYLDRNATIDLRQDVGRMVVTASPQPLYARTRIDVITRGGTVEAAQPGTSFRVLVLPSQEEDPGRVDVSVLNGPDVTVQGAGQRVTVSNGQQSVIPVGAAPSAPAVRQRELVENGDFKLHGAALDQIPNHWTRDEDDGGDGIGVRATEELAPDTIRGQPVTALHILRAGGNTDSDLLGIQQVVPFGELDEYDSVVLSADIKVVSHSVSGGGVQGSEYPLVFLVRYMNARGEPGEVGRGFYVQNDEGNPTAYGSTQGIQVKPGVWGETFRLDLKQLYPAPVKLVNLSVYASGHDYDAYVANISIVAK